MELKERFEYIKKCIINLDELLKKHNSDEIVNSFIMLASILYILQTSIQALIDIGLRFLAELGKSLHQHMEILEKL